MKEEKWVEDPQVLEMWIEKILKSNELYRTTNDKTHTKWN